MDTNLDIKGFRSIAQNYDLFFIQENFIQISFLSLFYNLSLHITRKQKKNFQIKFKSFFLTVLLLATHDKNFQKKFKSFLA